MLQVGYKSEAGGLILFHLKWFHTIPIALNQTTAAVSALYTGLPQEVLSEKILLLQESLKMTAVEVRQESCP